MDQPVVGINIVACTFDVITKLLKVLIGELFRHDKPPFTAQEIYQSNEDWYSQNSHKPKSIDRASGAAGCKQGRQFCLTKQKAGNGYTF